MDINSLIVEESKMVNDLKVNKNLSDEELMWARLTKPSEESGEVVAAYMTVRGMKPIKNDNVITIEEVKKELLDTANAALMAYEHITNHSGDSMRHFFMHIQQCHEKLKVKARFNND